MLFGKRKIKIRKYQPKRFETYDPVRPIGIRREETIPLIFRIGSWVLLLGGLASFFVSSLFFGVIGFFGFQRRVRKIFQGDVVEIFERK